MQGPTAAALTPDLNALGLFFLTPLFPRPVKVSRFRAFRVQGLALRVWGFG